MSDLPENITDRITPALASGWQIIDTLDADTKERLFGLLEQK